MKRLVGRWPWDPSQTFGGALVGLGILLASVAVFLANTEPSWQALLLLATAASEIGAVRVFNGRQRVDASHARSAVRRLLLLHARTVVAEKGAEVLAEERDMTPTARRQLAGQLSVQTSWVRDEVAQAVKDWEAAMPWAFNPQDIESEGTDSEHQETD